MTATTWDDFFSGQESDTREEIVPGTYSVIVHQAEATTSSSGSPMVKVILAITDEGAYKGRWLWEYMVVDPANAGAFGMFVRKAAALGLDDAYFRTTFTGGPASIDTGVIARDLVGRTATAQTKYDMYQGQKRAKIQRLVSNGTPTVAGRTTAAAAPPPPPPPPPAPAAAPAYAAAATDQNQSVPPPPAQQVQF